MRRKIRGHGWPSQVRFWNLKCRYRGFSGAVGSGKSVALAHAIVRLAVKNRGLDGIVGAPVYGMLEDIMIPLVCEHLAEIGIRYRTSGFDLILKDYGSTIMFRGLDNPDRIRGRNAAWAAVDELTYCKEDAWKILADQRVRDPRAVEKAIVAAWTPKGFDWVYGRFLDPERNEDFRVEYEAILAGPAENKAVLAKDPRYYERMKASYDRRFFRQEALGEYLSVFAGQAYHAWDPEQNKRPCEYDPTRGIFWALDFNIDPNCSVIGQYTRFPEPRVWVLKGISLPDANTESVCEAFLHVTAPWVAGGRAIDVEIYGDPSGAARRTSASKSDWQIVKEALRRDSRYRTKFKVGSRATSVKDRLNAVNGMLCNGLGQRRLFVDPNPTCKELIRDLQEVGLQSDKAGNLYPDIDKSNKDRTHASDALGYMIEREFGIRSKGGDVADMIF